MGLPVPVSTSPEPRSSSPDPEQSGHHPGSSSGGSQHGGSGATPTGSIQPPRADYHYINFRGYGPDRRDSFSVLCGDDPPLITGGYAKWSTVDRPLRRGVTIFQGYDPAQMKLSLRFGIWDKNAGWLSSNNDGKFVEADIEKLEWMAGAGFVAGQSPFVYVNTYGPRLGSTALIPLQYQETSLVSGSTRDSSLWPWIIGSGIEWGKAWRARGGNRVYQECTLTLTNFQGLSKPSASKAAGGYVKASKTLDTIVKIAGSVHPLDLQSLADSIKTDSKNNPISGSKIKLASKSIKSFKIPVGKQVWVPSFTI